MNLRNKFSIFLGCALAVQPFASSSAPAAERLRLGPANVAARINDVPLSAVLTGEAAVDSSNGDINLDGELTVTSKLTEAETGAAAILTKFLPHSFDLPKGCKIEVKSLTGFKITYPASTYEIRLSGVLPSTLYCVGTHEGDVNFDIALQPDVSDKGALGWKVLDTSKVVIPRLWSFAAGFFNTNPSAEVLKAAQAFLNEKATLRLPKRSGGINAAFKGANFDGTKTNFQLRIKGDAHANAATVTSYLQPYLDHTPLEFTFNLPQ